MVTRRSGASALGCLFFMLMIGGAGYYGLKIGTVYVHAYRFRDAMTQQAGIAARFTDAQIRVVLVATADSLGLPPEASDITIERTGKHIVIWAEYSETVELPLHAKKLDFIPRAESDY